MALPTLTGTARLTGDPELRYSASGTAVCKVNLAFNNRRKNESTGQWEDGDSFFVTGTVFKQAAENVAESLQRGTEVAVIGRLKTRSYETREGEKRSVVELLVDSIGPTLAYATAKVQKMSRSSGGTGGAQQQGGRGPGGDDPWAAGGQRGGGNFDDEPPF